MAGPVHDLLQRDHERLARLLGAACRERRIDAEAYREFRAGLLRHIGMEEKILLPLVKRLRGGQALEPARQLKLDHSALAALLVPTPTPEIVARIRTLLEAHNALEEGEQGVYAQCERIAHAQLESLAEQLRSAGEVKLAPYSDGPRVEASIARLLRAAGRA
jgi:hypothetical protein